MKKFTPLYTLLALTLCSLSYGQNSFPASGSVGIGTLTPDSNYALDVNGALNATEINVTNLLVGGNPLQSSPWNLNGNNIFYSSGNIGIGTNTPNYALDVSGTLNASSILLNGTPLNNTTSPWSVTGNDISFTTGNVDVATLNATEILLNGTPLENNESPWTTTGNDISFTTGDVDVATLNATEILLNGTAVVSSPWTISGNNLSYATGTIDVGTLDATNLQIDGADVVSSPWTASGNDISFTTGDVDVATLNATEILLNGTPLENNESPWTTAGNDLLYTTGNIGIGTPTPGYALDVAGTVNATNFLINGTPLSTGSSPWSLNGNDTFYSAGNVGIGTNTPGYSLDVSGTINATNILINDAPLPDSPWELSGNDVSYTSGNVGIGTTNTQGFMFAVAGNMVAEAVKVELEGNWPDFVFEKEYNLQSLKEIEDYIKENGHLPNVPSAEEIKNNGIDLGQMDATLLQKIEELTLHSIQQQKEIDSLKGINKKLFEQNKIILSLQERLLKLESKSN